MSFSLRFLFSLVTVAATIVFAGIAVFDYFSPSGRYNRNSDIDCLRFILGTRVKNGDSIEHVASLLGPGVLDDGKMVAWTKRCQANPRFLPEMKPDGFEDRDTFVKYAAGPRLSYYLQFRDGKIVNHIPKEFQGPDDTASLGSSCLAKKAG